MILQNSGLQVNGCQKREAALMFLAPQRLLLLITSLISTDFLVSSDSHLLLIAKLLWLLLESFLKELSLL